MVRYKIVYLGVAALTWRPRSQPGMRTASGAGARVGAHGRSGPLAVRTWVVLGKSAVILLDAVVARPSAARHKHTKLWGGGGPYLSIATPFISIKEVKLSLVISGLKVTFEELT